jgi:uncharacterized membrane protein
MAQFLAEKPAAGKSLAFRNRAGEITRLEALSDGTFAFAITLLVVSLEVPSTFDQLVVALRGLMAFGICFTFLMWIWFQHTRFFRRYGLEDAGTVALNGFLLFVVLFYVYPMKFLWTLLTATWASRGSYAPAAGGQPIILSAQVPGLMQLYALGFIAVFWCLALLYVLAYSRRRALGLNELEEFDTRASIWENALVGSVGLISMAIVTFGGTPAAGWSGMSYGLIGVVKGIHGYRTGKARERMEKEFLALKAAPGPIVAQAAPGS